MGEDRCVCCGEIIPEGNHVCPNCRENHSQQLYSGTAKKFGEEIGRMTGTITEVANWAEMKIRSNGSVEINIRRIKYRFCEEGEVGMTYKRGQVSISVHQLDGFGKNPALWIGTENPNQMVKVASFGSEDKADLFCKWLEYMLGFNNDEGSVKWE